MVICYARIHLSLCDHYPTELSSEQIWLAPASAVHECVKDLCLNREEDERRATTVAKVCRQLGRYLQETVLSTSALSLLTEQKTTAAASARERWGTVLLHHCLEQRLLAREVHIDATIRNKLEEDAATRFVWYTGRLVGGEFGSLDW